MTCVLASPWQLSNDSFPQNDCYTWSPMSPDITPTYGLERQPSHGYGSSESESRKPAGGSGKKRASRAGTRSVNTLSAAQLERKRANDREAQRAIRQRTKDHIDDLEKSVNDLRGSHESNQKLVVVTQQRNRELEEENAYLRLKLGDSGYGVGLPAHTDQRTSPVAPSVANENIQRPSASSTPRSASVTTSQSSESRQSTFQHQQNNFMPSAPSSGAASQTAWRPQDVTHAAQSIHSAPIHVSEPASHQASLAYAQSAQPRRAEWPQAYQYGSPEQQPAHKYEVQSAPPPPAQQQPYVQTHVQSYPQTPQAHTFYPPTLPPQAEFQSMAVSSPTEYQMQQQQAYQHSQQQQQQAYPQSLPQPSAYQMNAVQPSAPAADFVSPHGHMQPPSLPTSSYHAPPQSQHYGPPSSHQPMQYREDPQNRAYPLPHYPPG